MSTSFLRIKMPKTQQRLNSCEGLKSSSSQAPPATHAFKRDVFARQFDFNNDIIRKLTPLQNVEGISLVIHEYGGLSSHRSCSRPQFYKVDSGNRKSALMHKDFVNKEILELLSTGAIREAHGDSQDPHFHLSQKMKT
ncbi:unnamed protein product [Haemonchus placei]|uniref:Uncharacterized protein n=1 Tax=Haemonchus placei TaxID=6290 RepID=A0A0N4WQS8_HAEPC|nr:unnamed protein product [Haemonchus placei]